MEYQLIKQKPKHMYPIPAEKSMLMFSGVGSL